jgi:hypothetical protein
MSRRVVHVFVEEGAWRVELDAHEPRVMGSAEQALALARGLASQAENGEVRLHFPDGRVESEYFGDPDRAGLPEGRPQDALRARLEEDMHRRRSGARAPSTEGGDV